MGMLGDTHIIQLVISPFREVGQHFQCTKCSESFALFHMLVDCPKPSNSLSISTVSMVFFSFEFSHFELFILHITAYASSSYSYQVPPSTRITLYTTS